VSAAGSARLALVPPDAEVPAPPPFDALVQSSAAKQRRSARARRVASGIWGTGCALLLTGPLLAPATGDLSLVGMGLAGIFLLPASGFPLLAFALLDRSRAAVTTLMAAAVVLAGTIGLMGPARRAALEMYVAASQPELDALAAETRAVVAAAPYDPDPARGTEAQIGQRFGVPMQRLSIRSAVPIDGGLLFRSSAGTGYTLVYADGAAGPAAECAIRRLRFIGGRWFEAECRRQADEYD